MNHDRLLDRFLRYVRIDTTASDADTYPSSSGQLELGRLLVAELHALGLADAEQDAHGIVMATVPATAYRPVPAVALCAHLDTSPETTGAGVRPQVVRDYDGRDLLLPGAADQVLRAADNPELAGLIGRTIITTDGTTLLGADDKAGVAVIMELAAWLVEHPRAPHGPLRLVFTCDEEIGRGVDHIDLERVGAAVCYTLDGDGADGIDAETFSADLALVTVRGINIHPSIGKGKMINAVRAAAAFVERLPRDRLSPETTAGRDGFLHPYHVEGGVAEVSLRVLLRDFETAALADQAALLRRAAGDVEAAFSGVRIEFAFREQYRNLREGLATDPRAVAYAQEALRRLGRVPRMEVIRGGTDGSRLTALGLPTPNLSTGEHNPHSPLEWTCLEEMAAAVEGLVSLAEVWAEKG
jgi:tripeptide aminopeptidase